jgi:sodium/potassium/calcium exchanger 6
VGIPLTPYGVTLLSLGNGAPEIFEGIAAVRQGKALLAIVTLFGSCMFESSIITAGILLGGGKMRINQYKFLRDAGICLVGLMVVLSYGLAGEVCLYTGILLPIVYVIYVCIVIYSERKWEDPFALTASLDFSRSSQGVKSKLNERFNLDVNLEAVNALEVVKYQLATPESEEEMQEEKNCRYYCIKGLEYAIFPLYLIRRVTIPLYGECTWNRYFATATPFCGLLFTLYAIGRKLHSEFDVMLGALPLWGLVMILGAVGSVAVWFTTTYKELPRYHFVSSRQVFTIYAFIQSILWIGTISDNVMSMLEIIGNLMGVPTELLAVSLLTWGNGSGDFMSNYSIAKLGLSQTAITACFSGPSFDMLMGMGACFTYAALFSPLSFPMFTQSIILVSWIFFFISTSLAMLFVCLRRGKLDRLNAYYHLGFYSLYMVILFAAVLAI